MAQKGTLRGIFATADSKRQSSLRRIIECAGLTKPWYCVPDGFDQNQDLPENFQSIGAWGTATSANKIYLSLYPNGLPWFMQAVKARIRFDNTVDPDAIDEAQQRLLLQDLLLQSLLESTGVDDAASENRVAGFRTSKLKSITTTVITGDSLERMNDDFSFTVFARRSYVTKRDTEGRVLWHCTAEKKDYDELTEAQKAKAELKPDDYKDKDDPCVTLYTRVKWQPLTKVWLIEQEINDKLVNESQEKITPYISTAVDLAPEEDYGRGLVEQNWGDLKTLDECRERLVDWAGLCSKAHPILDETSTMKDEDFEKETGVVLRGRVSGGIWQDGTFMKVDKLNDLSFVAAFADKLEENLSRRFMSHAESVRDSERTTAFEVAEVTIREAESALGGWFQPFADMQQVPTFRRLRHVAQSKNLLPPMPEGMVEAQILTGVAALVRLRQAQALRGWVEDMMKLGPEAFGQVDTAVVGRVLARYQNIYEPGIIKSKAQLDREKAEAMRMQAEMQANEQIVKSTGAIAENAAAAAMAP